MSSDQHHPHYVAIREACSRFSDKIELLQLNDHPGSAVFWIPIAWIGQIGSLGKRYGAIDGNRWIVCSYRRNAREVYFHVEMYDANDESEREWRRVAEQFRSAAPGLGLVPAEVQPFHSGYYQSFREAALLELTPSTEPSVVRNAVGDHFDRLGTKLEKILHLVRTARSRIDRRDEFTID